MIMKTNGTQTIAIVVFLVLLLLFLEITANAQPKYDFRNATKISGTDRQAGALYRFPNVRTGTDALVTITTITGGLTLDNLDGTSSGFAEAFQPVITAPANSKGYVEFSIVFVTAGTSTPVMQTEVPITPIDVDGQVNKVYEFDDIYRYTGSYVDYNMLGGELQVSYPTASLVEGMNIAGVDYGGVDTTAKQVMFTVVNASISTLVVRTGADNKSNSSQQRLRSLYFQKFIYPNSILALAPLPSSRSAASNNNPALQTLKIFPSIIQSTATVQIKAQQSGAAIFRLADYAGRIVMQKVINVQEGSNNIVVNDLDNLSRGNYIAMVSLNSTMYNQKVIKQ